MGRDIDRLYLSRVQQRITWLLHVLIAADRSTQTTEIRYYIQRSVPVLLDELTRAESLRGTL